MSSSPPFHMPGAFNFDAPATSGQPLHANVFRPPPSPSASSYNLAKSTGSLYSDISMSNAAPTGMAKRKRTSTTRELTPMDWNMEGREQERSGEPRYTLAGQISATPGAAVTGADNGPLEESVYSDVDYRRALGPKPAPEAESPPGQPYDRTASSSTGWSLFSLQMIGDVVGKVWEFCKKGAFRGFHAGGGTGYNVDGSAVTKTAGNTWNAEPDTPAQPDETPPTHQVMPEYSTQQTQNPILDSPSYYELSTPESTPQPPAAKRRQVSANNDDLRNWVVVEEPSNPKPTNSFTAEVKSATARTSGLVRPRSGYYSQPAASSHRRISTPSQRFTGGTPNIPRASRTPLRISHAGSPTLTPREPASFASPRSSFASQATPSRIPVPVQSTSQPPSPNRNPFALPGTTATTTTATAATTSTFTVKPTASRPSSRQSHTRATSRHSLGGITARPLSPSKASTSSLSNHHHSHRRNQSSTSSARRHSMLSPALSTVTSSSISPSSSIPKPVGSHTHHDLDPAFLMLAGSSNNGGSPSRLDAEARALAQRRLAAQRDADAKVDAFNAKLLSMIRQGREALGTKVEIEMEMEDGSGKWEDDD
ncbi:hypothetical protein VTK26DRAFT_3455 [Humicola hyalothermophila]